MVENLQSQNGLSPSSPNKAVGLWVYCFLGPQLPSLWNGNIGARRWLLLIMDEGILRAGDGTVVQDGCSEVLLWWGEALHSCPTASKLLCV